MDKRPLTEDQWEALYELLLLSMKVNEDPAFATKLLEKLLYRPRPHLREERGQAMKTPGPLYKLPDDETATEDLGEAFHAWVRYAERLRRDHAELDTAQSKEA